MTESTLSLRVLNSGSPGGPTLVCFPPGGGSATAYREWPLEFDGGTTILAVQYPGRQDRLGDPLVADLGALADSVAADLIRQVGPGRLSLFGHSMGAMLAFEVARRLERQRDLVALFVSGRPDPTFVEPGALHLGTDEDLICSLEKLSNDPASVAVLREHPDLAELVLPALRSDYRAVETYAYQSGPPLRCDLSVLVSDRDPTTTRAQAAAWKQHTSGNFELTEFPGGHFYLDEIRSAVCAVVVRRLRTS